MIKEINLSALPNFTSYGLVATNIIKQLVNQDVRVNLFPVTDREGAIEAYPEDHEVIRQCLQNAATLDYNAPSVRLWHQFALTPHAGRGLKAGWPIFELDTFNDLEKLHLSGQDRLLVCSEWAKDVISRNSINVPTYVVPLGVDTDIFHPNYHTSYASDHNSKNTAFYMVGKQEERKALSFILECFEAAFDETDNVELHMLWFNRLFTEKQRDEWVRYYKKSRLAGKIEMYDWQPTQRDVAAIISNLDCGLFVSRAEGWDLGLLESFACARECIVTDYSGHTEFATSSNSWLIPVIEKEVAYDGIWFHGQGNWAKLGHHQKEVCVYHMRDVHRRKQSGYTLFNATGVETAKQFSWTNSASKLLEALQ